MPNTPRVPAPNSEREIESWRIRLSSYVGQGLTVDDIIGTENQITVTPDGTLSVTLSLPQDIDTDADVEFASITLDDLTASRLVASDGSKKLVSTNITSWAAGTENQITITPDGTGGFIASLPAAIYVPDGQVFGLGAAKGRMVYNDEATDTISFMDCNVGYGTLTPDTLGHFSKASATAVIRLERVQDAIVADDVIGRLEFEITDLTSPGVAAYIQAIAEGTDGEVGIAIATGTGGAAVEAIRIDHDRNIGINTLIPAAKHHVVGDSRFGDQATNYATFAADGELTLVGTARVLRHIRVGAGSWKLGASGPTAAMLSVFPALYFDDASDDEVHYEIIAPHRMAAGSVINVIVDWCHQTALDTGTVTWKLEYNCVAVGENVAGATTTIAATSGASVVDLLQRTTLVTGITGAVAHDIIGMRLYRDVGTGTLTGDAILIDVHFEFTMDKLGEPT